MSEELEQAGKLLIYQNEKGNTRVDVYFDEETIPDLESSIKIIHT